MTSPLVAQFSKFVIVGLLNTAIDFGVLNLLSFLTGVYSGAALIALNSVAFLAAVTNSYFLNKYWTFAAKDGARTTEISKFLIISFIGLGINNAIVYGVTTFMALPLGRIGPALWENLAKMAATGISLIWNFIGYKFFVFKK